MVKGATSRGGEGYNCQTDVVPASDPRFAFSPELVVRLRTEFPPGSTASNLRSSLVQQGFRLEGPCSPDHSISFAQFRLNKNEVVSNVFWRVDTSGRIVWTYGEVFFTFL